MVLESLQWSDIEHAREFSSWSTFNVFQVIKRHKALRKRIPFPMATTWMYISCYYADYKLIMRFVRYIFLIILPSRPEGCGKGSRVDLPRGRIYKNRSQKSAQRVHRHCASKPLLSANGCLLLSREPSKCVWSKRVCIRETGVIDKAQA